MRNSLKFARPTKRKHAPRAAAAATVALSPRGWLSIEIDPQINPGTCSLAYAFARGKLARARYRPDATYYHKALTQHVPGMRPICRHVSTCFRRINGIPSMLYWEGFLVVHRFWINGWFKVESCMDSLD